MRLSDIFKIVLLSLIIREEYRIVMTVILTIGFLIFRNWILAVGVLEKLSKKHERLHGVLFGGLKNIVLITLIVSKTFVDFMKFLFLNKISIILISTVVVYYLSYKIPQGTEINFLGLGDLQYFNLFLLFIGFNNPNDEVIHYLLNIIIRTIAIVLPLSITFYFFTYKEQKLASHSAIKRNYTNLILFSFIICSIITLAFSHKLNTNLDFFLKSIATPIGQDFTLSHLGIINSLFYLFFTSVGLGIASFISLWKKIDIAKSLDSTITSVNNYIFGLSFSKSQSVVSSIRKNVYQELHYKIESIYQMLRQSIENQMIELYEEKYQQWEKSLRYIHSHHRLYYLMNEDRYLYLLRTDPKEYLIFYKAILKNQLSLIISLYKNHKINEGNEAVRDLFSLSPKGFKEVSNNSKNDKSIKSLQGNYQKLLIEYFLILYELSVYLYKDNNVGIHPVLENMENIVSNEKMIEKEDIFIIYRALVIKAVEQNDAQFLSSIINTMYHLIIKFNPYPTGQSFKKSERLQGKRISLANVEKKLSNIEDSLTNNLEEIIILIILEAILKSVEIGRYSFTGYLIKSVVSNFYGDKLDKVFQNYFLSKAEGNIYLSDRPLYLKINAEFKINELSKEYCFEKMAILIYGQQKYAEKHKLFLNNRIKPSKYFTKINTKTILGYCNYIDYLFLKFDNAGNKYGLSFMTDKKFMQSLKQDIYFNNGYRKHEES